MNMADLTLTFQRHLALLVRSELGKGDESLRLILRSDSIPQLLAWLTSPARYAHWLRHGHHQHTVLVIL